jgi:hypothetical protein
MSLRHLSTSGGLHGDTSQEIEFSNYKNDIHDSDRDNNKPT